MLYCRDPAASQENNRGTRSDSGKFPGEHAGTTADFGEIRRGSRILCRCGAFRPGSVPMLSVVLASPVYSRRFRPQTVQCSWSLERGDKSSCQHHDYRDRVIGNHVRPAQLNRGTQVKGTHIAGAGQRTISTLRSGHEFGRVAQHPAAVSAFVFP